MSLLSLSLYLIVSSHPIETMPRMPEGCVLIVGTNDMHGHLEPHRVYRDNHYAELGGLRGVSAYLSALRKWSNGRVVLLDAGDAYHGTYESNAAFGRDVIKVMNLIGYDAMALGNHEFDFGPTKRAPQDPRGHLKARLSEAEFPVLSANLAKKDRQEVNWKNLRSHMLIDIGSLKLGVIGASTIETSYTTHPRNVVGLRFGDPVEPIIELSRQLRDEGADAVILLGHMGGKCAESEDPLDITSCDSSEELPQLLNALPPGTVEVALGGHTHQVLAHYFNSVATIETGSYARNLGVVKLCKTETGSIDAEVLPPLPMCLTTFADGKCTPNGETSRVRTRFFFGEELRPQKEVLKLIGDAMKRASILSERLMGIELITPLKRVPHKDSPLGKTIASAVLEVSGADLAIQNRGGVRSDLPRGVINHRQLYTVLPFANMVSIVHLPTRDLIEMLEHMAQRRNGLLPYIAGLDVETRSGQLQILEDGRPIPSGRILKVAVNDYIAAGGENLGAFFAAKPHILIEPTSTLLFDAVADFLSVRAPLSISQDAP